MSNRLLAGRYELIEKIGEGGMAIVYKAKCRLLNRYVAIKILRPEFTKTEAFVENFRKESQAAAGLTHPNIVSVYDVGKEENIHYIVMELVEGKPLSEIIEEKVHLDYKEAIEITKQVASALSLAHKNQIVHRDVKPHNIMITNTGVAKLADFGIARAVTNGNVVSDATSGNKVMGSVHYISPEQARGAYVDERTDIYSLGIVMYEMLTGQVPFDGDSAVSIALKHINDTMTPPSQLMAGIPPQLEKLILKATDKYQSNRFKTADEMIEALDDIDFITKAIGKSVFIGSSEDAVSDKIDEIFGSEGEEDGEKNNGREKHGSDKEKNGKVDKKTIGIVAGAAAVLIACILGICSIMGVFGSDSGEVVVPYLTGYTFEEASLKLEEMGLQIEQGESVYSPDQEEGKITSQTPSADSEVTEGTVVTVNISLGKKDDVVPYLVGKNVDDVEAYLKEFGFELGVVTVITSTEDEGTVLSQSIQAGSTADKGTKINVEVSNGSVEVPKILGKNYKEIESELKEKGLEIGTVKVITSTEEKDTIISQSVAAGSVVESGTVIDIEVSDGEGVVVVEVPNLMGLSVDEARNKIKSCGLTVGEIQYEENEYADPDTVIHQDITPGTEVDAGTVISLVICKEVETVPDPAPSVDESDDDSADEQEEDDTQEEDE